MDESADSVTTVTVTTMSTHVTSSSSSPTKGCAQPASAHVTRATHKTRHAGVKSLANLSMPQAAEAVTLEPSSPHLTLGATG